VQEDERPGGQSRVTLVSNTLTDVQGSAVLVSDGASAALFDNTIRRSGAFAHALRCIEPPFGIPSNPNPTLALPYPNPLTLRCVSGGADQGRLRWRRETSARAPS
jgi:hypothetical protein